MLYTCEIKKIFVFLVGIFRPFSKYKKKGEEYPSDSFRLSPHLNIHLRPIGYYVYNMDYTLSIQKYIYYMSILHRPVLSGQQVLYIVNLWCALKSEEKKKLKKSDPDWISCYCIYRVAIKRHQREWKATRDESPVWHEKFIGPNKRRTRALDPVSPSLIITGSGRFSQPSFGLSKWKNW